MIYSKKPEYFLYFMRQSSEHAKSTISIFRHDPVIFEFNNELFFNGTFNIYNNARFPHKTFYLNVDTTFASVSDINLYLYEKEELENNEDKKDWHSRDKMFYSFSINLNNWSQYNRKISNFSYYLKHQFYINKSVFTDFEVETEPKSLNSFFQEIDIYNRNFSYRLLTFSYSNYEQLYMSDYTRDEEIWLSNRYDPRQVVAVVDSFPKITKSVYFLLSMRSKKRDHFLSSTIYSAEATLEYTNKDGASNSQKIDISWGNYFTINLFVSGYYEYDKSQNKFIKFNNQKDGIVSSEELIARLKIDLYCNIDGLDRTIEIIKDFVLTNETWKEKLENVEVKDLTKTFAYEGVVSNV